MNFCAIICEFNPLHNGHAHIIAQAKKLTGLPVLCLMSGNFCQRAEPAILDKHTRARHAIDAGADVVFELPTIFATGSARDFARGAIHILKHLPVTHLIFGAECGNLEKLQDAAALTRELEESADIKKELKRGLSYKSAIQQVATKAAPELADILEKPNNTLAIEYLKALEQTDIIPMVIKREDNYLSTATGEFCSSSALREAARMEKWDDFRKHAPQGVLDDLKHPKNTLNIYEHLFFALQTTSAEKLALCPSISEGLEHRILKCAKAAKNFDEFLDAAYTKRYNKIRIRRVALENFFGITKQGMRDALFCVPTTELLAKDKNLHFDGFFNKPINLILKKSDKEKFKEEKTLLIDCLADKLYAR